MNTIQGIFNNREIAIGLWVIVAVILLLFTKAARQFLKTALPILFCKKFVVFYMGKKSCTQGYNKRPLHHQRCNGSFLGRKRETGEET